MARRIKEFRSRDIAAPAHTVDALAGRYRRAWRRESDWDRFAERLHKAGLPE